MSCSNHFSKQCFCGEVLEECPCQGVRKTIVPSLCKECRERIEKEAYEGIFGKPQS